MSTTEHHEHTEHVIKTWLDDVPKWLKTLLSSITIFVIGAFALWVFYPQYSASFIKFIVLFIVCLVFALGSVFFVRALLQIYESVSGGSSASMTDVYEESKRHAIHQEVGEKKALKLLLESYKKTYSLGQRRWSSIHHTCLYLSIMSGGIVSVLPHVDGVEKWVISLLAISGSVVAGISAHGTFKAKWESHRRSRSQVDGLWVELVGRKQLSPQGVEAVHKKLAAIIREHDNFILRSEVYPEAMPELEVAEVVEEVAQETAAEVPEGQQIPAALAPETVVSVLVEKQD